MSTATTHYGLVKPAVNSATDQDIWGNELNDDLDSIDSLIYTATNWVKRVVTGTDTATTADINKQLLGDATSASYVQTLPSAATAGDGCAIAFVKTDATAHTISITRAGSDTIGLSTSPYVLSDQNVPVILVSDGVSNWNFLTKSLSVPDATTSVKGIAQLATTAEALDGTDTAKIMTPADVLATQTNRAYDELATATATGTITTGSVPTTSDGTQILTATITPTKATNRIRVTAQVYGSNSSGSNLVNSIAAFKTGSSNAIHAVGNTTTNTNGAANMILQTEFEAGGTSAITITIRAGSTGGTFTVSSPTYGGVGRSTLVVEEVRV